MCGAIKVGPGGAWGALVLWDYVDPHVQCWVWEHHWEHGGMKGVLQAGGYGWSLCRSRGFGRRANDPGEVSCGLETGPRRAAKI